MHDWGPSRQAREAARSRLAAGRREAGALRALAWREPLGGIPALAVALTTTLALPPPTPERAWNAAEG
ncbi:MAG: hypothetical protein ACYCVB_06940 [Bacilli bacterium]